MIIIDGSFLLGIAAILSSVATLWRAIRDSKELLARSGTQSVASKEINM